MDYHGYNGIDHPHHPSGQHDERKRRNYKLLVDPMIEPGAQKIYRFDGVAPADADQEPVLLRDPRSRIKRFWNKREAMDMPVPKFKFDVYYVGTILPKEVTFTNVNDNINHDFLKNMCASFGQVEEAKVYFHPRTKKHLGVGKVLFTATRSARICADKLNQTSKMGMIITAFVDPFGKDRAKMVEEMTAEKITPAPPPVPETPTPPTQNKKDDPRHRPPQRHHRRSDHSADRSSHHQSNRLRLDSYEEDFPPVPGGNLNDSFDAPPADGPPLPPDPIHMNRNYKENDHRFDVDENIRHRDRYDDEFDGRDSVHRQDRRNFNDDDYNDGDQDSHRRHNRHHHGNRRHGRDYDDDSFDDHNRSRDKDYDRLHDDEYNRSRDDNSTRSRDRYGKQRHKDRYDGDRNRHKRRHRDRNEYRRRSSDDRDSRDRHYKEDDDFRAPPERRDSDVSLPPEPTAPEPAPPEPPETPAVEEPRLDLDSRIQSLLGGFGASPTHDDAGDDSGAPPLPDEDAPPLPPGDAPPLPNEPPPLPPEPDEGFTNGDLDNKLGHFAKLFMHNGLNDSGEVEDDRMSMSSAGSDHKIEINTAHMPPPPLPPPPIPPMPQLMWPPNHPNPSFHNHIANNMYNQGFMSPFMDPVQQAILQHMQGPLFTEIDEKAEKTFLDALDQIINQLKMIMKRDLCKKMVQVTAFKTYDNWLASEDERRNKVSKTDAQYLSPSKSIESTSTPATTPANSTPSTPAIAKPKADGIGSASIAALFERKDNSMGQSFGMGGLLGFSGGFPKMPSFRKKFIKPSTPPPEEEEEEDEDDKESERGFVGPRTPEESENEEKMSEGSMSESELRAIKERRKKKVTIYSSSSDEDESEDEEEEEEDEEGSDVASDEEEIKADDESSDSDIDVEATSPAKPTSPLSPKKTGRARGKQRTAVELPSQEIEPATFPLADVDDQSEDSRLSPAKELSDLSGTSPDTTPLPSDSDEDMSMDIEAMKQSPDKRNVFELEFSRDLSRKLQNREEQEAALALLRMHEVSAEEKERQRRLQLEHEQQIRIMRENVEREHCYLFKGDYKKRPRDPLPDFRDVESDATDSASEGEPDMIPCLPGDLTHDHQYCALYHPIDYTEQFRKTREKFMGKRVRPEDYYAEPQKVEITDIAADVDISTGEVIKKFVNRGKRKVFSDITNGKRSRELAMLLPTVEKPKPKYKPRAVQEQVQIAYDFLVKGIDLEDTNYLKRRYEELLQDDSPQTAWLNNVHWVDHTFTSIPDPPVKKRRKAEEELRKHETGCARTEGFYNITHAQKKGYLRHAIGVNAYDNEASLESILARIEKSRKTKQQQTRDARSESRRWQNVLSRGGQDLGDLVKFNQLKFRKKEVKFAKSGIHHWGLFALERIPEDDMVIEYVGQKIRQSVADLREKKYEQQGIGSSYLFRIDSDDVIDATKCGSVARFINHSCNPNCYAKIITVDGHKKIVIYSKKDIGINEEITYDYKFPLEDEKIPCLCGSVQCRGSLN